MSSGKIWPAHPHPLPDELLSSWIVRVATANGVRLQPLCWMLFGNAQSPWNRDVDRNAPPWLIKAFSQRTGISYWDIFHTTLVTYRTRLYPRRQAVGQLRWILPIKSQGMQRTAFGQQFCPECLATDVIPYFRKQWRVALYTYCPIHHIEMHDACPACGKSVAIFRGDFGRELKDARAMHVCHVCGYDFRDTARTEAFFPDREIQQIFGNMLNALAEPHQKFEQFDLRFYAVAHQLCRVMISRQNLGKLQAFIADQLGLSRLLPQLRRISFEHLRRDDRHKLLLCACWLIAKHETRFELAWQAKVVRYNLMLKDMEEAPKWYKSSVERLSDWRKANAAERKMHPR